MGFEPDFDPCKRWDVASASGSTAQYDEGRASTTENVLTLSTARDGTAIPALFMRAKIQLSSFGDTLDRGEDIAMTFESTIDTPAAAGALIRRQRMNQGLTQLALADAAGVPRKFLIDLESGHERAELGKTMAVLAALGLSFAAAPPIPRGGDHDPERRDYAATFTDLLARKDFEFAFKMLADYASASLKAGQPLLQRSPQLKGPPMVCGSGGDHQLHCSPPRPNRPVLDQTHQIPRRGVDAGRVLQDRP
ncbi:MAG: helix-turn-helix domain-containing protein [Specibacter sp.]